jgi:AraC-like DNA-binding protein
MVVNGTKNPINKTEMDRIDRLTSLLECLRVKIAATEPVHANLVAFCLPDDAGTIEIALRMRGPLRRPGGKMLFALSLDFGTRGDMLKGALPDQFVLTAAPFSQMAQMAQVVAHEYAQPRCGAPIVMSRMGEAILVHVLRAYIESGTASSGLLAGLSDHRIARAIVAAQEAPGKAWRNSDLAQVAGLSESRFKELFSDTVGLSPASYLRNWRMDLAQRDLARGDRVEKVARRYGYRAPDAFSRAYLRHFGHRPKGGASA